MSNSTECSFFLAVAILASTLSSKLYFSFSLSLYAYLNNTGGLACVVLAFCAWIFFFLVLNNEVFISFVFIVFYLTAVALLLSFLLSLGSK